MADNSGGNGEGPAGERYAVPITGLLALVFALVAGGTAYPAVATGSVSLATLPVIFGVASLLCLRLRQRYVEAGG